MILPAKHLRPDRSLAGIGAEVLASLTDECTVSELWEKVRSRRADTQSVAPLSFDWFVLALSFLFAISAVDLRHGVVVRAGSE